jgi:hypothetical protein
VLTPGEKLGADLSKRRQLVVRKMRDGMGSICVDYRLHVWDTNSKQIVDADDFDISLEEQASRTLVIEWGKEVRRYNESDQEEQVVTAMQRKVLNKLNQLLNSEGEEPPAECGCPAGLRAIKLSRLQEALYRSGLSKTAVTRCKTELLARDLIGFSDDWIWIALGGT